ncbi:uncharacterized protein LOC100876008 [Megachile rotundata]|uniref:uncharacterized protein LOC100876008 n=1 Tax=Megachile rotundata TaxID=143995 RepID=UPI000258DF1C|nr:PREDICTED: uncharacterized protein LOC100876008 [Megachile rotundata]
MYKRKNRMSMMYQYLSKVERFKTNLKMKSVILWSLLMAICFLSEVKGDCKNYDGQDLSVGVHYIKCNKVTCHEDGSVSATTCPVYFCQEGKQIGYRERDISKPYPECCEGPICAT